MSSLKNLCLISALVLILSRAAVAAEQFDLGIPIFPNTHTHTSLELEPIPNSSSSYQISATQFLPDVSESDLGFSGNELEGDHNTGDCNDKEKLFTTKSCTYPKAVVESSKCAFIFGSYKKCECLPSFKISTCTSPKIQSSPICNGKSEGCICPPTVVLNNRNDVCTQRCDGNCIAKSCTASPAETDCHYGITTGSDGCGGTRDVCQICNLTTCTGISSKPSNSSYVTSDCTDCNGTRTVNSDWECNSGYSRSGSGCVKETSEDERTAALCVAAGYSYIWTGNGSNGCGGHYQKYYRLPEWICPYNPSYGKNGCGVCSDIPDDNCISSHQDNVDIGKGRTDLVWFGEKCDWAE